MAETVLKVQRMDDYENIGGVIWYGMQSDCGKNAGISTLEAECSNPYKQIALTQMAHEDHGDLNSAHSNTCMQVASSSEFSDLKAANQSNRLKELEISVGELSNNEELPQYPAMEKPRQSGQLAVNEIKSFPGMENTHVRTEKEQRMSQLESDVNELGRFVECTHRGRLQSEQVRKTCEGIELEVKALEVNGLDLTVGKVANQGEQEGHQTRHPKSNEVLGRLQMPSRFFEYGSVEASGPKDCIELRRSEDLNQTLVGRDGTPRDPSVFQDQLLLSFQRKEKSLQQAKEEIVTALEASELKAEEQSVKLTELENILTRFKEHKVYLEKRCVTAETKVRESSSLLCQLQTKLDYTTTELFEAKSSNVQVDAMKLQLQECEEELRHARAQGALAESSLRELKLREDHIEEVEQGKKELEERLKWRNEQFQSLEEAHSKLRLQFEGKSSEWDAERSALVSDIDSLQVTVDSKESILREMQEQLQMVHHALSHEETRRKVLELEAAESRQVLVQATAGYERSQITWETLREQSSAEKGALRNTLAAKDRQIKDLQVKYVRMEQEYNELKEIENEYQAWQSNRGEQQRQCLSLKEKLSCVVEAHDNLRSRMKELEKDTEKERRNLVQALDQAHDHLGSKDEALKQLDSELDRVKGALDHAQGNSASLDVQLKQCQSHLEGACEEAATARQALKSLENSSRAEKSLLLQSIHEKDKLIEDLKAKIHSMDQTIAELSLHEEERLLIHRKYEELQQRDNQREAGRKELEVIHSSVLLRVRQEKNACLADGEKLLAVLQVAEERADEVQKQLNEAQYRNERHLDVIRKLEARCDLYDEEEARDCLLANQAREQLAVERTEVEKRRRETRTLDQSLSAALGDKDLTAEKLKDRIGVLETRVRRKDAETVRHNERVSHLEMDLKETAEVLCNMEHITVMKSQACKTAKELNVSEHVRTDLEEEMKTCQEESLAAKVDLESKLEVARRELSVLSMQLKAATRQVLEVSSQKELVLKDLDSKESVLTRLTVEHKTLVADKDSLEQVVHVLETKEAGLFQEVVSSRTSITQLVNKYEIAQSNLASSLNEVKALQAKLQHVQTLGVQLLKAEEQNRDLEGYLKAAKAIAQDKEEKLAASEWAVQQLALDVGKAKAALTQKDREEAVRRDELVDVERQLREKEGALIEMECYLEDALMSRESMQRELDRLRQQMEDFDRGAADWKRMEQDMTTQLEVIGAALEEKSAALIACGLEIERGHGLREVMDEAIDSLKLQLAGEQKALSAQQKDMSRLCEDQVDMNLACEVALARKEKMEIFLHELEQSHDSEKEQLENLQMEHKRLTVDLDDDGGFDCTFEIDISQKMHFPGPRNTYNIKAAKFGTRDDQIRPKFHLEEFKISAEDCTLGGVQEAREKELEILKLHGEESQRQVHELAAKLDAALSNVTTKNLIIKQVNDEMSGLRSLVKKLEQEAITLQSSLHGGERQQCSVDTGNLTSKRGDQPQYTGPEKRKAAIQEELDDYLDVCDSLVRKNVRLEKQLDGLQRNNRGLRRQVEELQLMGKSSSDKERRALDPVDCRPELLLHGFCRKTNPNVVKPAAQERIVSLQDICQGKVLVEIDENTVPGSLERCQMSRRPPVSPGTVIQQKKAKRVKDEV